MATMPFTPCSSTPCTDVAVSILQTVFGPVIQNLTQGSDPSGVDPVVNVIATMMGYFNSGVLTVATLIVSFVTVVGVINTANDGEAFGRNWSSLWTPVRIVSGAAVLLPTGTGYSFIQLVVMMFSLWAVGFANGTFEIGVKNQLISGPLQDVSQKVGIGSGATMNKSFPLYNMREMALKYMNSSYCSKTINGVYGEGVVTGLNPPAVAVFINGSADRTTKEAGGKSVLTHEFKDRNPISPLAGGGAICGTVSFYKYDHITPKPAVSFDMLPSSVYSADARNDNNEAISILRDAILASKLNATKALMLSIDDWVSTWPTDVNKDWSGVQVSEFNQRVEDAQQLLLVDLHARLNSDNTLKNLMQRFNDDITGDGWVMAGGYYQRLGGIREELRKIYAESPGDVTQPALGWLPNDAKGNLVRQSMTMPSLIARKAMDTSSQSPSAITDTSNVASIIPTDFDDVDIDQMGSRGNKALNSFVGNLMESVTNTAIGADGDVDAMARIKTTGDILAVANSTVHTVINAFERGGALAKGATALVSGVPILSAASAVADVIYGALKTLFIDPLTSMIPWLDTLAFYFGVFLPSLPYMIFIIAVVGWFLAVLQTVFAAPLWAVMHMTPDRTFIGSQTQGYLMFLSLFMRPVLIIAALFAATLLANPIILYVSKAFWAMRTANVSSAESIGFYVQFLTWKNWLIMYGMILLPVVYMIYGLTNTLPDAILTWIGAGIKPLGETQATAEMRGGMERHGVGGREAAAARRLGAGGGAAAAAGRLPAAGGGGAPGGSAADNRLLSDTGQAGVSQTPDHVPGSSAGRTGGPAAQAGSRRFGAAAAAGAAVGAGAALTASGAVAGQAQDEAIETPSSNHDRPMHNEANVQAPDHAAYVGKDGEPLSDEAARTAGIGALLNADMANPSGTDTGEPGAVAA